MSDNFIISEDKSIIDKDGKIIFFSVERFIEDIANGDCCFICGAKRHSKIFNDEHVIPDWILRKYNLQNDNIILPNRKTIKYSQYKVPCCQECNSMLSEKFEKPISSVVSQGLDSLIEFAKKDGFWLLFKWLSLIFIKVHLKDKYFRLLVDNREPDYKISELYDWESFHHIHCVARSVYSECPIDKEVFGSFFILEALPDAKMDEFDFGDNFPGKGILIRLGKICLIAILNDSCGSSNLFADDLYKIKGALNQLQYREILARLAHINVNLKNRPVYYTNVNIETGCVIKAKIPKTVEYENKGEYNYGEFLYGGCHDILTQLPHENKEMIIENVKKGSWTFLFNENGEFINN